MAASTTKKVLIRRYDKESLTGYVHPQAYLRPNGVELITPDGNYTVIPYQEVKTISFVRDFGAAAPFPERLVFHTRPKMDGLWVRMKFRDGEVMEGILANNLLQLDVYGFTIVPPDFNANCRRVFVPRAALTELQVLGVVGSPLRQPKKPAPKEQIELFEK